MGSYSIKFWNIIKFLFQKKVLFKLFKFFEKHDISVNYTKKFKNWLKKFKEFLKNLRGETEFQKYKNNICVCSCFVCMVFPQ